MWFTLSLIRYNAEKGTLDLPFLENITLEMEFTLLLNIVRTRK
jgi:hypothetical protein